MEVKGIKFNDQKIDFPEGKTYNAGEGLSLDNNTFSVKTATKKTFGAVRVWEENDTLFISTEPLPNRTFSQNSASVIASTSKAISASNLTSEQVAEEYGWNLGDKIPITLSNGEVIEMRIIGFNHDTLSDGTGKAGLTLDMVDCLATDYLMYPYGSSNAGGYPSSSLRNSTFPTLKAMLPQEWQDIIKLVDKKSANGGSTNYTETVTTSDDLFLLSEIELFGTVTNAQDGVNEGGVYEYWNGKTAEERTKHKTRYDGFVYDASYLLRSCPYNSTDQVLYCASGQSYSASNTYRNTSFAFCV